MQISKAKISTIEQRLINIGVKARLEDQESQKAFSAWIEKHHQRMADPLAKSYEILPTMFAIPGEAR